MRFALLGDHPDGLDFAGALGRPRLRAVERLRRDIGRQERDLVQPHRARLGDQLRHTAEVVAMQRRTRPDTDVRRPRPQLADALDQSARAGDEAQGEVFVERLEIELRPRCRSTAGSSSRSTV